MNIKRCSEGHYYDADKCSVCPRCEKERNDFSGINAEDYSATEPADGFDMRGFPNSGFVDDIMSNTVPATEGYEPDFVPRGGGIDDYGVTQAGPIGGVAGFTPVAGWLVCIDGPERGKDFRIRPGYNSIGRNENMDICLRGDDKISGNNDSIIGYDDDTKTFSFGHQNGKNPVKVNNKLIINQIELKEFDILTIGSTRLIFVPLCGERFDWNKMR